MKQGQPNMKKHILESNVFGSSLKQLTKNDDGLVVPYILFRLCNFIEMNGMTEKGLFNSSTNPDHLEYLKTCFNQAGDVSLETESSILSAADLLKLFLLELADPVIPSSMHAAFSTAVNGYSRKECAENLKIILLSIPEENYIVLKYISQFLYQITCHNIQNETSASALGNIFGPLIFRINDENTYQDMMRNEVVTFFISDYQAIFGKEIRRISPTSRLHLDSSKMFIASSMMSNYINDKKASPVSPLFISSLPLPPLSVVIPPLEEKSLTIESDLQIPALIIDREKKVYEEIDKIETISRRKSSMKIKDSGFLNETHCIKSFEARTSYKTTEESVLIDKERMTYSHQEVKLLTETVERGIKKKPENLLVDEETDSLKENILEKALPAKCSGKGIMQGNSKSYRTQDLSHSHDRNMYSTQEYNHTEKPFQLENNNLTDRDDTFPPLEMNYLQDYELDDEPVLSEQRFSWPLLKSSQDDDDAMLSPTVNFLRSASSSEAPLSPSAYKVYLLHRSVLLDPSVPPSPPKEQDDFCSRVTKNAASNIKVKQLKKKIHSFKKKLKQFDETFEDEHGYRPSRVEKMSYPNMKKLIVNLNKARKDLKEGGTPMAEAGELMGQPHWLLTKNVHILEDTTNSTTKANDRATEENEYKLSDYKNKSSVQESFKETLKNLNDERKQSHRPEAFEAMTKEEILDEKLSIQKALLQLEDIHGRPIDKLNRDIMRPLYDRYHNIKCFIRGGNAGSASSAKDAGTELQPIIENVAMEFTPRQDDVKEIDHTVTLIEHPSEENEDKASVGVRLLKRYSSSNLHELPFSELLQEQQQTRAEKRKLRRILKEFEDEFHKKTGKKVQNEDRLPMEKIYAEYKHMKGRLRLLEALVYKQKQHKLN